MTPVSRSPRPARMRRLALALALLAGILAGVRPAHAVTVSPSAVYIDGRSRSSVITLVNQGGLPEEIEISFAFGYPHNDASGQIVVPLFAADSVPPGEPSAVGWIRAFPRRLVLQPGQKQVVRILVNPPRGLPDGEYWARILVSSTGGEPPVEKQMGNGVSIALRTRTVIVTAVSYRQGDVRTGVQVDHASAAPAPGGVALRLDLSRLGNAAYLGHLRAELLAPDGKLLGEADTDLAVYRQLHADLLIPLERDAPPGSSVRFRFSTERPDLPPDGPLPAAPVRGTVPVA